jgi:hypothetical protein
MSVLCRESGVVHENVSGDGRVLAGAAGRRGYMCCGCWRAALWMCLICGAWRDDWVWHGGHVKLWLASAPRD